MSGLRPPEGTPAGTLHELRSTGGVRRTFEWTGRDWTIPGGSYGNSPATMQRGGWSYLQPVGQPEHAPTGAQVAP